MHNYNKRKCAQLYLTSDMHRSGVIYIYIWYQNQNQNMNIIIVALNFKFIWICFCLENGLGAKMKVARLL